MATPEEPDFPPGHPKRFDYDPKSPEARAWARQHIHPAGERDWPVGHPKAVDTKGNTNHIPVLAGVDPAHPEREAFSGHSPEQVEAERELWAERVASVKPTPTLKPIEAPPPPDENVPYAAPSGQPGLLDQLRGLLDAHGG